MKFHFAKVVKESLILVKNEGKVLPLKRGSTVFLAGPDTDNVGAQCGGWSVQLEGDTKDMSLTGGQSLPGNQQAINLAKKLKKPTVALIVAGREVLIQDYLKGWDSVVMCYPPGSEGEGVSDVLTGKVNFKGKLSMQWYKTVQGIGTNDTLFSRGYGLTD